MKRTKEMDEAWAAFEAADVARDNAREAYLRAAASGTGEENTQHATRDAWAAYRAASRARDAAYVAAARALGYRNVSP